MVRGSSDTAGHDQSLPVWCDTNRLVELFGYSRRTWYRRLNAGEVVAVGEPGSHTMWNVASVLAYFARRPAKGQQRITAPANLSPKNWLPSLITLGYTLLHYILHLF
jgi:hypothetical protein